MSPEDITKLLNSLQSVRISTTYASKLCNYIKNVIAIADAITATVDREEPIPRYLPHEFQNAMFILYSFVGFDPKFLELINKHRAAFNLKLVEENLAQVKHYESHSTLAKIAYAESLYWKEVLNVLGS